MDGTFSLDFVVALAAVAGGFTVAVLASQKAVSDTAELASGTHIPRFVIGFVLLGIGTDLPEIANSIAASVTGHGDINVGDSIGSAVTQVTLILGLVPILGRASFRISRSRTMRVGVVTGVALSVGALLMADGVITRFDATVLAAGWLLGAFVAWAPAPPGTQLDLPIEARQKLVKAAVVLISLGLVAAGAVVAVWGLVEISETLGVSEFVVGFVLAAIGTSLPELVVAVTAARRSQSELAIGDIFGSSFADTTLSLAAGPLIVDITVTADVVVRGSVVALASILGVVALLAGRRVHDWRTGLVLVGLYAVVFGLVI